MKFDIKPGRAIIKLLRYCISMDDERLNVSIE